MDMSVGEFFGGAWTFIVNLPLWAAALGLVFFALFVIGIIWGD